MLKTLLYDSSFEGNCDHAKSRSVIPALAGIHDPHYISDSGADYDVESSISDPDSMWIVRPQFFFSCALRHLNASRNDRYNRCKNFLSTWYSSAPFRILADLPPGYPQTEVTSTCTERCNLIRCPSRTTVMIMCNAHSLSALFLLFQLHSIMCITGFWPSCLNPRFGGR